MNRLYINKTIIFFLVFIMATCSFGFVQGVKMQGNTIDVLDQKNGGSGCGGCGDSSTMLLTDGLYVAQGFTPSHNILSKIVVFLTNFGITPPGMNLTLVIREALDGNDLVSMEKEVNVSGNIFFLIDFDIQDINVVSGKMYYIIVMTDDVNSGNYEIGWNYHIENPYSRGSCWTSFNKVKWFVNEEYDLLFETYWKDYSPSLPTIIGPNNGVANDRYEYTFSTNDPEGDDIEYFIEWGDGKKFTWIGPYESGEQVIKSHSWTYGGNYTISVKARDSFGAESDLATFDISLTKIKVISIPLFLQRFFQCFPLFEKILNQIQL